ncbi:MAG: tetratricopeptide repeat protein [Burkholderiales bacterium]|nr:tetratricopeptide repeat protein [Bacteroidia bacterium]
MKARLKILIALVLFQSAQLFSQNTDSLKLALKSAKEDTVRIKLYLQLCELSNVDELADYIYPAIAICEKNLEKYPFTNPLYSFYNKQLSIALNNAAYLANHLGDSNKAMGYYFRELKINLKENDKEEIANSYNNIGFMYSNQGDIPKALDYYFKSLTIHTEIADKQGMALTLNNIGTIYKSQKEYQKALDQYHKSLKLKEEIGDKKGIAVSYNNIGLIYKIQALELKKKKMQGWEVILKKAVDHYEKSLKIREDLGDKKAIASVLNNIGVIYDDAENVNKALEYYEKALKLREEISDKQGICSSLNAIGGIYRKQKRYSLAEKSVLQSLVLAREIGYPQDISNAAETLYDIYKEQNNGMKALEFYKLFDLMKDSINNTETQKAGVKKQLGYEFNQKEINAKAEQEKKDVIASEEKRRQSLIRNSFIMGFLLVLVLAGVVFKSYRQKQKANKLLEEKNALIAQQKNIVEQKHKEITDSINYAERIQRSFLASDQLLKENLIDYFVFFQPKDIVSGDFYWADKLSNGQFVLVTADSTGHGVPGAIMSILNISCLEKSVEEKQLTGPAEILNHTRTMIIERLKKDGSAEGGKDGMDCSLISFDFKNSKLTYAAANNPVWIVRNNQILELAADKIPVGKHDRDSVSFSQHTIDLHKNDVVYAITDGMPDQFGGPKGKKFMYKQLKELLISISGLPMQQQKQNLSNSLNLWKNNLEQVDDITIVGVRV